MANRIVHPEELRQLLTESFNAAPDPGEYTISLIVSLVVKMHTQGLLLSGDIDQMMDRAEAAAAQGGAK